MKKYDVLCFYLPTVGMFVESTSPVLSLWSIDDFPVPGRPNNTILGSVSWNKPTKGFPSVVPIFLNQQRSNSATKLTLETRKTTTKGDESEDWALEKK